MNLASIVLLAVIVVLFLVAIRHIVKSGGVCSCGTVGKRCNGKCGTCNCKNCGKDRKKGQS